MKLRRGVHPESVETDCKRPEEYIQHWRDRGEIWLRGTKTLGAERGTDLFLDVDEADVIALFRALVERCRESGEQSSLVMEVCVEVLSELALCLKSATRLVAPNLPDSNRPLEELEISVRAYNLLRNANIQTIGELARKSELEMLIICGRKALNEIKEVLTHAQN
jgi:hypothetical protein